jgi:hypothetical protein
MTAFPGIAPTVSDSLHYMHHKNLSTIDSPAAEAAEHTLAMPRVARLHNPQLG